MVTDETARLAALRQYRILDTEPEQAFDDLTLLASQSCSTPIALISLVDEDKQWFKSRVGIEAAETSRCVSFCSHAIQQSELFVVPDALDDERFRNDPSVLGDPKIRFYAGAPLMSRDGEVLGTLCVIDVHPRNLDDGEREALEALRRQVEAQLDLRRNLKELRTALGGIERLETIVPYCSTCKLDLVVPADLSNVSTVNSAIRVLLESRHWQEEEVAKVEVAVEEALTNAIRHGCKNDSSKEVQCLLNLDESGEISIVVRDSGTGFDPTTVPNPRAPENLTKPGGRGVFLINALMDTVEYADEGRQVSMRKRQEFVDDA